MSRQEKEKKEYWNNLHFIHRNILYNFLFFVFIFFYCADSHSSVEMEFHAKFDTKLLLVRFWYHFKWKLYRVPGKKYIFPIRITSYIGKWENFIIFNSWKIKNCPSLEMWSDSYWICVIISWTRLELLSKTTSHQLFFKVHEVEYFIWLKLWIVSYILDKNTCMPHA